LKPSRMPEATIWTQQSRKYANQQYAASTVMSTRHGSVVTALVEAASEERWVEMTALVKANEERWVKSRSHYTL